ncbi:MAG: ATP-binding cassette domain-containing protein, partial [Deltaproteobacteria bacterium]|nr:ATP-binding cassette domain-containing protein [Deltaproteobacteria bacterium]
MAVTNEVQLKVENIHMAFGGVQALMGVSFEVKKGEIFSIIGPNGAGKTVLLNCINGLYTPQKGKIEFDGKDISSLRPYQRAERGISRTFQKLELFKGATVLDNIRLGRHIHLKSGLLGSALYFGKTAREEIEHRDFIEREIIDLLEIEHMRHKVVGMLPYGLQKRVELARALALNPKIILLDEPLAG